jgi:thymidylate kinase
MTTTSLSLKNFLESVFIALDLYQVRYCVLHSYTGLPDTLTSDLDMGLHPSDLSRLSLVFDALRQQSYYPLQHIPYSAGLGGSHYFVFGWFGEGGFMSAAIDFTCQHREGGAILTAGDELVRGRRKRGLFWIPDPAIEFRYLLAKKVLKGAVGSGQADRLGVLAREIGREASELAAGHLFAGASSSRVVDACLNNTLADEVAAFRCNLLGTIRRRDPFNRLRYWVTESPRLCLRMLKPTGLFVAILGPDGVGKSSLLPQLLNRIGSCFRRHKVFHWRPELLGRTQSQTISVNPHDRPNFSPLRSILHLAGHGFDFILGYWLVVYPARVRSGLALFDRYFEDLIVDPKRYRYGGPLWLPRFLGHLIPSPELLLILDAPPDAVLARKKELARSEIARLRRDYRDLAYRSNSARVIDASGSPDVVAERALLALSDYLSSRFKRDYGRCVQDRSEAHSVQLDEVMKWLGNGTRFRDERVDVPSKRRSFAVVPSTREPRWVIPLQNGTVSLAAMKMFTPYTSRARFFKRLVLCALKLPGPVRPGDVISLLADGVSPLEALVANQLGEQNPAFGISFGTSGHHRKLTVQVMNVTGEILAYIKIPMTEFGNDRVRYEASVLRKLATYPALRAHVPKLIFAGEWQGRCILVQSALRGSSGPTRLSGSHFTFLRTLWDAQPTFRSGQDVVNEVSREWEAVGQGLDMRWQQLAEEALYIVSRRIEGIEIPCGITHGDFAPWNTRTDNGHLSVFDWECAGWAQPNWWDVFHFETQTSTLLKQTLGMGIPRGDPRTFQSLYMMYLIASTCQILRDEPAGTGGLHYRRERLAAELRRPVKYVGMNNPHGLQSHDLRVK